METIAKWVPLSAIPNVLYIETMVYNHSGLKILLKEKMNNERKLKVHFKLFLGFRSFAEFYRLKMVSESPISNSPDSNWTLFISENDDLMKWMNEENYGAISQKQLKNYVIWTPDDIVEVLSEEAPLVEWV